MALDTSRGSARAIGSAVAAGLAFLVVTGCTALGLSDRGGEDERSDAVTIVHEDGDDRVALAPATGSSSENDHPVDMGADELRALLSGIDIVLREAEEGSNGQEPEQTRPLFKSASLDELSEPLVEALGEARPDQDVLLRVKQVRTSPVAGWFQKPGVTTARLFHRDDHLHVIAGAVDASPFQDEDNRGMGRSSGRVERSVGTLPKGAREGPVAEAPVLRSALDSGSERRHRTWLALDRSVTADARSAADRREAASQPDSRRERDTDADSESDAAASDTSEEDVSGASGRVPGSESLPASTEQRLERLRELRRQELISESVYESLVREALREEGTLPADE